MLPEEQAMQMPMQGNMMQPQMPMDEVSQMEVQEAQEGLMQILQVIETLVQQGLSEDEILALLAQYGITEAELEQAAQVLGVDIEQLLGGAQMEQPQMEAPQQPMMMANGGLTSVAGYGTPPGTNRFNYPSGGVRVGRAEGGLMDLGGMEKDYRTGGFVDLGAEERADDVPARLSKNEFVFTADAVRNAGGGDIDKGAEVMQNMMDNLEAGGTISEESQGMNPAQEMFDQAQMMENRIV